MGFKYCLAAAASLALAGCGSCLNSYPGIGSSSAMPAPAFSILADGRAFTPRAANPPVTVSRLVVWANSEVQRAPYRGRTVTILVGGATVGSIDFADTVGVRSLGPLDITRHLVPGTNDIEIRIVYGIAPGGSRIRGSRMARGEPAGSSQHVCFESDAALTDQPPTRFSVNYQPASRMARR